MKENKHALTTTFISVLAIFAVAPSLFATAVAENNCEKANCQDELSTVDDTEKCIHLNHIDYSRPCGSVDNLYDLHRLQPGECAIMNVSAKSRWNASGLLLESGVKYDFTELKTPGNCWEDNGIVAKGDGWKNGGKIYSKCPTGDTEKEKVHESKWIIGVMEWLRRYPTADWFTLIGVTSKGGCCSDMQEFVIGRELKAFTPDHNSEFCSYANDVNFMYWNNDKELSIKIERSQ